MSEPIVCELAVNVTEVMVAPDEDAFAENGTVSPTAYVVFVAGLVMLT